jgi:hypothetical protein
MMAAAMARARGEEVSDQTKDATATDSHTADVGEGSVEESETRASLRATTDNVAVDSVSPIKVEEPEATATSLDIHTASSSATTAQFAPEKLPPAPASPPNKYDSYSVAPAAAYMPGRSAAARERAAANIPSRRSSGRVKELAKGAFGERVPARALVREDFGKSMLELYQTWGGFTGGIGGASAAVTKIEATEGSEERPMELD